MPSSRAANHRHNALAHELVDARRRLGPSLNLSNPLDVNNPANNVLWLDAAVGTAINSGTPVGRIGQWADQSPGLRSCNDSTGVPPGYSFAAHGALIYPSDPHLNGHTGLGGPSSDATSRVALYNTIPAADRSHPAVNSLSWGTSCTVHVVSYISSSTPITNLTFGTVFGFDWWDSTSTSYSWIGTYPSGGAGSLRWALGVHQQTIGTIIFGPQVVLNVPVVQTWRQTPTTVELLVNGVSYGTQTKSLNWTGYVALSGGYDQANVGACGQILGYTGTQSDAVVAAIVSALRTKFAVP